MDNFLVILVCIGSGMLLRATGTLPRDSHKGINAWLLYIALPAVSLKYLPKVHWSTDLLFPMASTVIVWAGGWLFIHFYTKRKRYGQRSKSSLELASGYGNTSFIGFPLIVAYFGEQYLSIAIICDQVLFILLSTAGIIAATKGDKQLGGKLHISILVKKLLTFPPFIGCFLALTLPPLADLSPLDPFLGKLTATVAPMALFSVGSQLRFDGWARQRAQLSMALCYKLIFAPALVLIAALSFGVKTDIARISIFEAAMPTFITASVLAEEFHLNFRLVNLIIGASILLGFLTTYGWAWVLQFPLFPG